MKSVRLCPLGRNHLESLANAPGILVVTQEMVKNLNHNNNDSNQQHHIPERFSDFF